SDLITGKAFCLEYQRLLKESQIALTNWNSGRAEIHNSGRRGRDTDNKLRTLQGNFARAWAVLQWHDQRCEICQPVSIIEGRRFPERHPAPALQLNSLFLDRRVEV